MFDVFILFMMFYNKIKLFKIKFCSLFTVTFDIWWLHP